jgi:hypothetical protein
MTSSSYMLVVASIERYITVSRGIVTDKPRLETWQRSVLITLAIIIGILLKVNANTP